MIAQPGNHPANRPAFMWEVGRNVMHSERARAAGHFARGIAAARELGQPIDPASGCGAIINRIVWAAMANDSKHLHTPRGKLAPANAGIALAPPTIDQGGGGARPTLEPVDDRGGKIGRDE